MSFQKKQYNLKWEDGHALHGLEVSVGGVSIGDLEIIGGLQGALAEASTFERIMPLLEIFSRSLVKWNYEDGQGVPIGTSLAEIKDRADVQDVIPVIVDWVQKVGAISVPLVAASNSGETFPEGALPMEAL